MKHINLRVYGRVQGVFYRKFAQDQAQKLNIVGNVKNIANGTVLIEAEGSEDNLDKFINVCHQGPILAKVTRVEIEEGRIKNYRSFDILKS